MLGLEWPERLGRMCVLYLPLLMKEERCNSLVGALPRERVRNMIRKMATEWDVVVQSPDAKSLVPSEVESGVDLVHSAEQAKQLWLKGKENDRLASVASQPLLGRLESTENHGLAGRGRASVGRC